MAKSKTYKMIGKCGNCQSQQEFEIRKGKSNLSVMDSAKCDYCGNTGFFPYSKPTD